MATGQQFQVVKWCLGHQNTGKGNLAPSPLHPLSQRIAPIKSRKGNKMALQLQFTGENKIQCQSLVTQL